MTACFHSTGNSPTSSEILNSLVTAGAILVAVSLSIFAEIPSAPLALVTSSASRSPHTSSSVHSRSCKLSGTSTSTGGRDSDERGGSAG